MQFNIKKEYWNTICAGKQTLFPVWYDFHTKTVFIRTDIGVCCSFDNACSRKTIQQNQSYRLHKLRHHWPTQWLWLKWQANYNKTAHYSRRCSFVYSIFFFAQAIRFWIIFYVYNAQTKTLLIMDIVHCSMLRFSSTPLSLSLSSFPLDFSFPEKLYSLIVVHLFLFSP